MERLFSECGYVLLCFHGAVGSCSLAPRRWSSLSSSSFSSSYLLSVVAECATWRAGCIGWRSGGQGFGRSVVGSGAGAGGGVWGGGVDALGEEARGLEGSGGAGERTVVADDDDDVVVVVGGGEDEEGEARLIIGVEELECGGDIMRLGSGTEGCSISGSGCCGCGDKEG